jgi:hypothetical protein
MLVNIRGSLQYSSLKCGSSSIITLSFPVGLDGATDPFGDVFLALPEAERPDGAKAKLFVNESLGSLSHTVA